jgi:ADP-heptose:LPS heptosyltransferase
VVLAGAASDVGIAREVLARAEDVVSLVGRTSVEELVALLAEANLVATGDSGPLHLAVALGVPLLAVYGPTDPAVHGPYNPVGPVVVHRRDLACSPCYTMAAVAECPLGDPICMRLVSVREMVASAVRLLETPGRQTQSARGGATAQPEANTSF